MSTEAVIMQAVAGLSADGRQVVNRAIQEAQQYIK